ncbi:MAG TPA: rhomboid family intramembrane serine protease [Verrucomicrobiae bacterium]|jgi:membrane associated rhomboid family serine protease
MLEDRDYMRQPDYYGRPRISFTVALLVINAVAFIAQLAASHSFSDVALDDTFQGNYLALSLDGLKHGYLWQLLTFQFMHANWLHILCNSIVIFFFGRAVEMTIGSRKFLALYLTSGVIGGLFQVIYAFATKSDMSVVGASAGGAGLVGAFAMLYWEERFTIFLYFLFPVNITGKILFWGSIALALVSMLVPNNVANVAHLGGIFTGALFARQIIRGGFSLPTIRREEPEFVSTKPRRKLWGSAPPPDEESSADDFLKSEVDPILDKISAHGIQSLTTREREILEKARSKMTKR